MSEQVFVGQRHYLRFDGGVGCSEPSSHQFLEHDADSRANPWTTTAPPSYISTCRPPSYGSASDPSCARPPNDHPNVSGSAIHPRRASCDLNVNVKFGHEATRRALAWEESRKLKQMSMPSVGLGESGLLNRDHHPHSQPSPELQSNSNSTNVTSWIMRTLSIKTYLGSNKSDGTQGREPGLLAGDTTKARSRGKRATSTVSLPPGIGASGSSLDWPPLGSAVDDHAKGESHTRHGTANGDKNLLYRNTVSSVPTQLPRSTAQSIPNRLDTGRKLVKKWKPQAEHAETVPAPRDGGAQGGLRSEHASTLNIPRIQTIFTHEALLPNEYCLAADVRTWGQEVTPARIGPPCLTYPERRWTLADIDDDDFLRQIEARLVRDGTRLGKSRMLEGFVMGTNHDRRGVELEVGTGYETDDSATEREFARGRRAIMCVREIVRTERSYLQSMVDLLQENQSAMSPILLEHLPRLIKAAARFIERLEEDPSVWGVSAAFLAIEEQLEEALVNWSGVVGRVISSTRTWTGNRAVSEDDHVSSPTSGNISSLWSRRRPATTGSLPPQQLRLNRATTSPDDTKSIHATSRRKLAEQNVAIMPTQRTLRYVLMYRELLLHTSVDSLSRPQVELALQGATRIARLCDEAQTLVTMHSPK